MRFIAERIEKLLQVLKEQILSPCLPVTSWKCLQTDQTGLQQADTSSWPDFDPRTDHWSGFRTRYWFAADVTVPEELEGLPVGLTLVTGAEGGWDLNNPQIHFYIDGRLIQGLDINHRFALITPCAKAGETFHLALFAYTSDNDGFLCWKTDLCGINQEAQKLYFDAKVPFDAVMLLDPQDQNRIDALSAINEAFNLLDLREVPSEAFQNSLGSASEKLQQAFYHKPCDESLPVVYCVGHSHIDLAWLWTLAITREKAIRTFSSMLRLMDRYPEFIFTASQAPLYQFVQEDAPEVYAEIKKRIAEGRWDPEGAMYVEADCNLTSGESLVRQVLYGKRFFKNELGVDSKVLWLPDVFGYSAALPQILRDCGVDYFMTTKISWNEYNQFPFDSFRWRGIDGTEILSHFIPATDYQPVMKTHFTTYNGMLFPSQVKGSHQRYQQKHCSKQMLFAFGHGDGGGGPTAAMLENARRMQHGLPGLPRTQMSTVRNFFEQLDAETHYGDSLPYWAGELYFEYHRGTYTSQARIKRDNRRNEFLLGNLEKAASAASLLGEAYPDQLLQDSWQTLMLNQFHDILPGSSIAEVYEEAARQHAKLRSDVRPVLDKMLSVVASHITASQSGAVVFNPSGVTVSDVVAMSLPPEGVPLAVSPADRPDQIFPVQQGDNEILFFAQDIPANGYRSFVFLNQPAPGNSGIIVTPEHIETPFLKIEMDSQANLVSIYDKNSDRQILTACQTGNLLEVYEDRPYQWDAWDINDYYRQKKWNIDDVQGVEVLECGPVRGVLRIRRRFMKSTITQEIRVYADQPRIDFHTSVDWQEHHLLLKAAFPVDIHAEEATYEIQYGNVTRPAHRNTSWDDARFEVCAHKWADFSEEGYGVSLLNDYKYGYDIHDSVMRLTLIKSATYPDPQADIGEHVFTYSLLPHLEGWRQSATVSQAYALNNPLLSLPLKPRPDAALPNTGSLMKSDKSNVIVEVIKQAEDSDCIIARLYECHNRRTQVTLHTLLPVKEAWDCGIMEDRSIPLITDHSTILLSLRPYEIRTIKLRLCT